MVSGSLPIDHLRNAFGREPLVARVSCGMIGQLLRFGIVGIVSTVAYAVLYVAFHAAVGAQTANFVALLLTAIFNTAANRAFAFGVRDSADVARHQFQGLIIFGIGLAGTTGSLAALHFWVPDATRNIELTVLVLANLVATLVRFVGLRWVFRAHNAAEMAR